MVAAIRTEYRDTSFRSRSEARWAGFFDAIGWRWTYEPLDADGYIPDFLIHGTRPLFVEVGPLVTWADFEEKSAKPARAVGDLLHDILVVGVDPVVGWADGWMVAGRLGERQSVHVCELFYCDGQTGVDADDWLNDDVGNVMPPDEDAARRNCSVPGSEEAEFEFARGLWARCAKCGLIGVFHEYMGYTLRPCGHYDGDHYLGDVQQADIERAWAKATNGSQWRR